MKRTGTLSKRDINAIRTAHAAGGPKGTFPALTKKYGLSFKQLADALHGPGQRKNGHIHNLNGHGDEFDTMADATARATILMAEGTSVTISKQVKTKYVVIVAGERVEEKHEDHFKGETV